MKSAPLIASSVVDSARRRIRIEGILNVQEENKIVKLSPSCEIYLRKLKSRTLACMPLGWTTN